MKSEIERLRDAILAHPSYVSDDDSLDSVVGVIHTACLVLDRIKDDVSPVTIERVPQ